MGLRLAVCSATRRASGSTSGARAHGGLGDLKLQQAAQPARRQRDLSLRHALAGDVEVQRVGAHLQLRARLGDELRHRGAHRCAEVDVGRAVTQLVGLHRARAQVVAGPHAAAGAERLEARRRSVDGHQRIVTVQHRLLRVVEAGRHDPVQDPERDSHHTRPVDLRAQERPPLAAAVCHQREAAAEEGGVTCIVEPVGDRVHGASGGIIA